MKHIKWNSIGQFREAIRHVRSKTEFQGLDFEGNPIMDRNVILPTIKYQASVKLHGTNAAVAFDSATGEMWVQSRENIITPQNDNAGFAMFVEANQDYFRSIDPKLLQTTVIFGEWVGKGIQKGVAVSELEKTFFVFSIVSIDAEGTKHYWNTEDTRDFINSKPHPYVKSISNYPTWIIDINFEHPEEAQNQLVSLVEQIEAECPVGKAHGISDVGEGIVLRPVFSNLAADAGYWFKVKGEKHQSSKVKTLAPIDVEKLNSINELVTSVCTENRMQQMLQQVFGIECDIDIKRTGEFIKAVMTDIWKEEKDTILESGFTMKEINGPASKLIRNFLLERV